MRYIEKDFSAVLFDFDGTLVNSEPLKAEALGYAVEHAGGTWRERWYAELLGHPWRTVEEQLMVRAGIPARQGILAEYFHGHYQTLLHTRVAMTTGAEDFVHRLHEHGHPLALVTSESRIIVETVLKRFHLMDCFQTLVCGDDILNPKPAPDSYRMACKQMHLSPAEALVFEDTDAGFTAAIRAGITQIIGLSHDWNQNQQFHRSFPTVHSFLDQPLP
ncbi:HAD family phosphatase [Kistimonas scapharcae]|uniref:HAD family phosphatase n=1 Tax=Kistimonas scapharcae TaxID=1036133 RepID=A0ABP8V2H9_9GAMM